MLNHEGAVYSRIYFIFEHSLFFIIFSVIGKRPAWPVSLKKNKISHKTRAVAVNKTIKRDSRGCPSIPYFFREYITELVIPSPGFVNVPSKSNSTMGYLTFLSPSSKVLSFLPQPHESIFLRSLLHNQHIFRITVFFPHINPVESVLCG